MPSQTTKLSKGKLFGNEIEVQRIDFVDRCVLFLRVNGEVDSTYDVKAPDTNTILQLQSGGDAEFTCEKTCLVGNNSDLRLAIVVSQISRLLYSSFESRNLIISFSSKLFGKNATSENSLEAIMTILNLIKGTIA